MFKLGSGGVFRALSKSRARLENKICSQCLSTTIPPKGQKTRLPDSKGEAKPTVLQQNPRPAPDRISDFASPKGLRYTGAAAEPSTLQEERILNQAGATLQELAGVSSDEQVLKVSDRELAASSGGLTGMWEMKQVPVPEYPADEGIFRGQETSFPCITEE